MLGCSVGQLDFVPACSQASSSCYGSDLIKNGVVSVPIEGEIAGPIKTFKNNVIQAVRDKLEPAGIDYRSFYTWLVTPAGIEMALAFASGTFSCYKQNGFSNIGVIMHEVGHNLRFKHSGYEGGWAYGDKKCNMGNAAEYRCYNGAMLWQSGWYEGNAGEEFHDATKTVDVLNGESFDGLMVSVDDYANGRSEASMMVVVKISNPSAELDYYINYDVAKGLTASNTATKSKFTPWPANAVTVVLGDLDQTSWLQGFAEAGKKYIKANFGGSGNDLHIEVCEKVSGSTESARVLVYKNSDLSC